MDNQDLTEEEFRKNMENFVDWASKPDCHSNLNTGEEAKICNLIFTFTEKGGVLSDSVNVMVSGENAFTPENEALVKNCVAALMLSVGTIISIARNKTNESKKEIEEIESVIREAKKQTENE